MMSPMTGDADKNRKGIRFTDEELDLFNRTMKRDGMSQLTTWMKSICTQYANGRLVACNAQSSDESNRELVLLRELVERYRVEALEWKAKGPDQTRPPGEH